MTGCPLLFEVTPWGNDEVSGTAVSHLGSQGIGLALQGRRVIVWVEMYVEPVAVKGLSLLSTRQPIRHLFFHPLFFFCVVDAVASPGPNFKAGIADIFFGPFAEPVFIAVKLG